MAEYATDPASRARVLRRLTLQDALEHDPDDYSIPADVREKSPTAERLVAPGEVVARILDMLCPGLDGDLAGLRFRVEDECLEVFVAGRWTLGIPRVTLRIGASDVSVSDGRDRTRRHGC